MSEQALTSQSNNKWLAAGVVLVIGFAISIQMLKVEINTQSLVAISIAVVSILLAMLLMRQGLSSLGARLKAIDELLPALSNQDPELLKRSTYPRNTELFIAISNLLEGSNQGDADASSRVLALQVCQANVMLADPEFNITYFNDSLKRMLKDNELRIQKELPNFSVDNLVGQNIDTFHKNPAHQRHILAALRQPYETQIKVAGLTFDLIATPVFDDSGERVATLVEWKDLTRELELIEKQTELANHNARITRALDVCQANVMVADNSLNIIYANDSVKAMLSENQAQLRESLPNFDVQTMLGSNIDVFHKNPQHQRGLLDKLTDVYSTEIKVAGFTFGLIATPVFDEEKNRIGTVVEWDDKTQRLAKEREEQALAAENLRIKRALDSVSTNTMIADDKNNIVYMNRSVKQLFKSHEEQLKKMVPNFDYDTIVGSNIDIFHKNPAHQRGMMARLETTFETEIEIGSLTFGLTANPIQDAAGARVGTVVEWNDRTEEVAIEREVNSLVQKASNGELTVRIEESGKEGFYLRLAKGLNSLVATVQDTVVDMGEMLDSLATGNLTRRIERDYQGSYEKLKEDANKTAEKLTEVMNRIRTSANLVSSGADEISQGNADLSQRTEEQASSLEETAASMEEMTSTVKQNAENAKLANELAADTCQKATQGGEVVTRAVESMSEINDASKRIADIIGVIDEIAFQTNLLALNAAVEAARAGEQGRGFAVVAGEVRNLAQRSAGAAKEIKDLIRDSVSKVEDGTMLVNESGVTLRGIVDAVQKVTEMISDIAEASVEQSSGIDQVNKAISQMDEMTQQNAALVEQASAAGESMAEQANDMTRLLNFFTMNDDTGGNYLPNEPVRAMPVASKNSLNGGAKKSSSSQGQVSKSKFSDESEEWEEF
ncbi:methyl-accepting chemotaxis protein [Pseudoalteromonas sp. T1lg65]|uniref:methyl-accepting chemotaxis protein n=1 Tax=Pseudoalteromonas sp. T1lg65 TaxID=2077101 RepID=UPI003F798F23